MIAAAAFLALLYGATDTQPPVVHVAQTGCQNVPARVRKLAVMHLGAESARVVPSARLADLGADEISIVEVEMAIQQEFDLADKAAPNGTARTVQDLMDFARRGCRS